MPDHNGVTSGSGDHAEMAVPLSQRPQGTTNPASAGQDTGDGKNDLRAEMVEALRLAAQTRPEDLGLSEHEQWYVDFNCVDCDADTLYAVLAHGLAAAGWRPPLPVEDERHVIEFREDGWTIKHTLACRPALFDCPINRAAERDLREPPSELGRFECDITDGGRLIVGKRVQP